MKNSFFKILLIIFFSHNSYAENLDISAKNITIDKKNEITIFEENVIIKDDNGTIIKSNYANYNKKLNFLNLKNNIVVTDIDGNEFKSNNATYDAQLKILKSIGQTDITTSEGYLVETKEVFFNNLKSIVLSNEKTKITDVQKNEIYLDNFEYQKNKNIFKSVGEIKVLDKKKNSYEFSQIYIDEKKREILGTDAKAYLNQNELKLDKNNEPRIFSNAVNIKENKSEFIKSTFTMCDYRKEDKCPPWELSASKMTHDTKKKTIYYDNAIIRIYDIPVLYLPRLAHPDPTVDRRSGFLTPSYNDTKNLGSSVSLPYFWAIGNDKDLTINNRLFFRENPIFLAEYRQVFKNSDLVFDFGFTDGYKNTTKTKKSGEKSHFFSKLIKKFPINKKGIENNLEVNLQHVSNKKYLKLYKVESNLVNYETETLENNLDFSHYNDNQNLFASFKTSVFTTLAEGYNDKYEYILPELNLNKNLFSDKLGYGEYQSNFKIYNYDTNKYKKFFVNNLNWNFDKNFFTQIYDGKFLMNLKNINYEVQNVDKFKVDTTSELFGALGYLASIDLYKKNKEEKNHSLKPKMLLRYSPNHMRKEDGEFNLHNKDIFSLDRLGSNENFEGGANLTLGLDYERSAKDNQINFSIGQIINENKNNKKMPSSSSLDNRFSDLVGNFGYKNNDLEIKYNYSLDQNYKETNYNEIEAGYNIDRITFNLSYLEENKILDKKEYLKSKIAIKNGNSGLLSFNNKRNLITNSSEFYDLSYEYINDCLRAGLVYRREFYNDSELESENSLMFKVTLNSFGSINSPGIAQ